ncbi:MAG: TusE/DsrC/DsvC family sulfur relay protein [Wenzhouxiangellaceae bacterium]
MAEPDWKDVLAATDLDEHGHLVDAGAWTPELARAMAAADGITLTPLHWWVIEFVRDHYRRYGTPPLMRVVVSMMREQTDHADASSRTLYRLFPAGPIREACRYGGLPRPDSCL